MGNGRLSKNFSFWIVSLILCAMFRIKSLQRKDLILNSEGRLDSNRLLRRPRGYLRQAAKPGFSGFRLSAHSSSRTAFGTRFARPCNPCRSRKLKIESSKLVFGFGYEHDTSNKNFFPKCKRNYRRAVCCVSAQSAACKFYSVPPCNNALPFVFVGTCALCAHGFSSRRHR